MPIYEYSCLDCGARFDLLRSIKEADSPADCKQCAGKNTKRVLSTFFSKSGETSSSGSSGKSCGGCSGGSCGSCGH